MKRAFLVLCLFCLACLACLACLVCVSPSQAAPGVFGKEERPATQADAWHRHVRPMWERVVAAEKATPGFSAHGDHFGPVDAPTWRNLVAYASTVPEMDIFKAVNGYFTSGGRKAMRIRGIRPNTGPRR